MIGWGDVYKVIEAMVPLYVALILGYGSVKWWRIIRADQTEALNRLVCYFTLPLFTVDFTTRVDPFRMNYRFIVADGISKVVIVAVLGVWAKCCSSKGSSYWSWSITSFSLSTLTNSLVVGVPLARAMYGQLGVDLVVQASVIQAIIWLTVLLLVLELRRSWTTGIITTTTSTTAPLEDGTGCDDHSVNVSRPTFWGLIKVVSLKMAMNPNAYACVLGLAWAFVSKKWHLPMPSILEASISIMSRAGTGTAMFSMGIFMALQEKLIACGTTLTIFGMVLRFVAGPAALAIGALAVGLHDDVLRVAIIQAAVPQSITSFIFAKEYGLHPEVLSTAVIFGMIVSLPVLIAYYAILEFVH